MTDAPENMPLAGRDFIDLFAGMGGFRVACESLGGRCVMSSEIEDNARATYLANFGHEPAGDITKIAASDVPPHDILCGGFPCQAFSITGNLSGFDDPKSGKLFFDVIRIAKERKPEAMLLENVANLLSHDGGRTIKVIMSTLAEAGYHARVSALNASRFGAPTARHRTYLACFRDRRKFDAFLFPTSSGEQTILNDFLLPESEVGDCLLGRKDIELVKDVGSEGGLFDGYPQRPVRIGHVKGMKLIQGYRVYSPYGHAVTFVSTSGGAFGKTGGYWVNGKLRTLHPRECSSIMGFPKDFILPSDKNVAYALIGNSVVVPVIKAILKSMGKALAS